MDGIVILNFWFASGYHFFLPEPPAMQRPTNSRVDGFMEPSGCQIFLEPRQGGFFCPDIKDPEFKYESDFFVLTGGCISEKRFLAGMESTR